MAFLPQYRHGQVGGKIRRAYFPTGDPHVSVAALLEPGGILTCPPNAATGAKVIPEQCGALSGSPT